MKKISNYIGGKLIPAQSGQFLDVYNPATGQPYAKVPASNDLDVDRAVAAAQSAFREWSATSLNQRHQHLTNIAQLIRDNLQDLATAESIDSGKTITRALSVEIPRSADNFEFFANAITQYSSASHNNDGNAINYTLQQPLGVVAGIAPWNLPLYLLSWKIAPALAAGNTVIAKPSEHTPMTAHLLSEICIEAGLPAGVLNVVHGEGPVIGPPLISDSRVKAISFTGSTRVGSEIASLAAPTFKKISLEMGGKNAGIIFSDCQYQEMLENTIWSTFGNQGEICLCTSRLLIQENIYDRFKSDFVEKAKNLLIGDPLNDNTQVGALISPTHQQKVTDYVKLAEREGGLILCGGRSVKPPGCKGGWFMAPTVIEGLPMDCKTNQEEIFGPVVTLIPFKDPEEAITLANQSDYGLSATIWTENLGRAHRLARSIEAGVVWINTWMLRDLRTAFGGMKNSGLGREGGRHALDFFTEPKNVCIKL